MSQSLLRDGRPCEVPAHALHARLVSGVEGDGCVQIDAAHYGVGLFLFHAALLAWGPAPAGVGRARPPATLWEP